MAENAPNPPGEGGGAGTGDGQFSPEAFEKKILDAVQAKLNGFDKSFSGRIEKTLGEKLSPLQALLEKNGDADPNPKPNNGSQPNSDPEVAKLQRELKKQQDQLQAMTAKAEEAERAALEEKRVSAVSAALTEVGVQKVALALRALLPDVKRGEDGAYYTGPDDNPTPLKESISQFVKDNPEFIPARGQGGSGAGAGGKRPAGGVVRKDDLMEETNMDAFLKKLQDGVKTGIV